jgi:hypothetical protein
MLLHTRPPQRARARGAQLQAQQCAAHAPALKPPPRCTASVFVKWRQALRLHVPGCMLHAARVTAASAEDTAETARVGAEVATMRQKLADAKRAREEAQRARDAAELELFEVQLQVMAGAGSESSAGDVAARYGAPPAVLEEKLLARWPKPAPVAVQVAWSALRVRLAHSDIAAANAAPGSFEARCVHPPVRDALLEAMSTGTCGLRLWSGGVAAGCNTADFLFTHLRDRLPSLLGAAVLLEVKPPGELEAAVTQALNVARRRMCELFAAAQRRGNVPLHALEVFAIATDGLQLVVLRVVSGAPERGRYEGAVPCPSYKSPPLPLLAGWDFVAAAGHLPQAPPAGFVALSRVLCADAESLIGAAMPLKSVRAELVADDAAGMPAEVLKLRLGTRLGCGGSAEAYALAADALPAAGGAGAVLKLGRSATAKLAELFQAEERALRALAGTPGVPRLLRAARRMGAGAGRWPLLLLSPLGAPLGAELAARRGAARAAGAPPAGALRRAFADEVLNGVHAALRAAHAARLVHCDVRPHNVVFADGAPLLLDWGLARAVGVDGAHLGDEMFALDAVFLRNNYAACAWQDLASAALLWVAVAYGDGDGCNAPWRRRSDVDDTLEGRRTWLREAADTGDAAVAAVVERVAHAAAPSTPAPAAADYRWLPPC